jgi:dTDP-4-amino-4,6-dideoxygalactose transaminase
VVTVEHNRDQTGERAPVRVPYVALPLQMRRIKSELLSAIDEVLESGAYILGPQVAEFEARFAEYCGTRYAIGVSDGTAALILALRALGIGPGDEVITAPNSFIASAASAALLGATPRFADVRDSDMNLDPRCLEQAITRRTRAIIAVHLAGHPADMDSILEIGARHGLPVIEDAAQAVGSRYRGRRTGSMGLLGCFSLHPLKNLHAYGDAGVITTNDQHVYEWLVKARNHGLRHRDTSEFWSTNSRIDTLQAAMLSTALGHLDEWTRERRAIAAEYCEALREVVGVPHELPECFHTYQTFMIRASRREELLQHLSRLGVDAKVHYPAPIHLQPAAAGLGYAATDFPVATRLASQIVSLPLYPELTSEQRAAVIDGVRSFYQ